MTKLTTHYRAPLVKKERQDLISFLVQNLAHEPESRVFLKDIFAAYKEWRIKLGLPETLVTIDGFGRIFPKSYIRKLMLINGEVSRGLYNFKLR